jgi:serine/threonine-protein kinase
MTDIASLVTILAECYVIGRQIGAGGMATVYLAHDIKHDREVAIKVLRPELSAMLGAERFLQEIRINARLEHPHILTLIDSGETDGFLWYVLPYVRGESLRHKLTREKQLPVDEVVRIATQVAGALDYAHARGVIHRDVKPENILLHEGEAMVADFGIALAVHEAGGERISQSGISLGTPQYMSPEQAAADRAVDARSDVYSLAAVVYEMLTGEPPHTGATAQAVFAKLITERPTRIRILRETVPEHVESAVGKALAKVPADRFSNTMEFVAALRAPAVTASANGRRRDLAAAAGIAAVVLIGTFVASWHPWRRTSVTSVSAADVASVAVMPFKNLTGNPAYQYLSDGMTEEVIGQLTQVAGLKVISRSSAEALKNAHLTTRQIADTLKVLNVLDGSLRLAGNQIHVTVALIDAKTDGYVWTSSFDHDLTRDLTDVFAAEEAIARHVVDSLVTTVGARTSISRVVRTEHPKAYAAFLAGRALLYRRTRDALRSATEQFQQAIDQDSTYAPAYAGLASVYFLWVFYDYPGIDRYEAYGRAWSLADRATLLEPDLADGYAARGYVMTRSWAPPDSISPDFKRALQLRPNAADVHQWYAQFLARQRRYDEGLDEVKRAIALDPVSPGVAVATGLMGLAARDYDLVKSAAARTMALEPSLLRAQAFDAIGDLLVGNASRCTTLNLGAYTAVRALCLHSLGRTRDASQIVDSLRTAFTAGIANDSTFNPVITARGLAEYYAWTGNAEESLKWLDRAFSISPLGEDYQLINSALYDKVRNNPHFKDGLETIRKRTYERVRRARFIHGQK